MIVPASFYTGKNGRLYLAIYNFFPDVYRAKIVTDLTLGYKLSKQLKLSLGANNLFNIYPDQQDRHVEAGGCWDAVQMGFSGAYYYTRLGFTF